MNNLHNHFQQPLKNRKITQKTCLKLVLITGGNQGIGKTLAARFAESGAAVVTTSRQVEFNNVLEVKPGTIVLQQLDVTQEASVLKLFSWIESLKNHKLDVLINNAGIWQKKSLLTTSLSDWESTLYTNLTGAFLCSREAYKLMKGRGGGRIINLGSVISKIPLTHQIAYGVSKWGLKGLSQLLAEEGKLDKVRITHITLGAVYTEMWKDKGNFKKEDMLDVSTVADSILSVAYSPLDTRIDEIEILPEKGVL